jgi:hypothetical protein
VAATDDQAMIDEAEFENGGPVVADETDENLQADTIWLGYFEMEWRAPPNAWVYGGFPRCARNTSGSALKSISGRVYTPFHVANGCDYRVWLYQWLNHTGYRRCVSPHSETGLIRAYKSWTISSNTSHC